MEVREAQAHYNTFLAGRWAPGITTEQQQEVLDTVCDGDTVQIGGQEINLTDGLSEAELQALIGEGFRRVDVLVAQGWHLNGDDGTQAGDRASVIEAAEISRMETDVNAYAETYGITQDQAWQLYAQDTTFGRENLPAVREQRTATRTALIQRYNAWHQINAQGTFVQFAQTVLHLPEISPILRNLQAFTPVSGDNVANLVEQNVDYLLRNVFASRFSSEMQTSVLQLPNAVEGRVYSGNYTEDDLMTWLRGEAEETPRGNLAPHAASHHVPTAEELRDHPFGQGSTLWINLIRRQGYAYPRGVAFDHRILEQAGLTPSDLRSGLNETQWNGLNQALIAFYHINVGNDGWFLPEFSVVAGEGHAVITTTKVEAYLRSGVGTINADNAAGILGYTEPNSPQFNRAVEALRTPAALGHQYEGSASEQLDLLQARLNLTLEVAGFRFSYTPLAADAVAGTAGTYHVRYGYHEFTVANRAEAQTYARMALRLSQGDDVWTNPNYGRAYHVLGYLGEDDVLPAAQAGQTITLSLDDLVGMVTGPLGPVVRRGVAGSRLIEVQRVAVAALISEHNVESDAPASPPVPNSVAEADGLMERGRRVLFNSPAITETPAHQANRLFRQAYESDPSPQRAITIIGYYLDRRRSPVSNVEGVRKRTLIFFLQWLTPSDITDENRALVERALTRVHASSDLRAQILGREGSVAAVEEAAAPVPEEPVAVVSTSTQPEPVEAPAGREAVGAERIAASMQRIVQERILTHGRTDSDSNGVLAGEERATLSDSENAALITAREEVGRSRAGVQRSLAWLGRLQTRAEEARATTLVSRINRYIDDGRALLEHINAAQEAENANQVRTAYSATAEARQEFLGIDIAGLESEVVGAERDAVAVAERRRVSAGATVTDTSEVPPEEEVERNSPQAHTASLLVAPRNIRQQAETQFTSRLLEQARNHSITISRRVVYTGTYDPVTGAVVLRYNYPGPRNGISALETYVRTISFTVSSDSTLTGRCRISFSYIPQ